MTLGATDKYFIYISDVSFCLVSKYVSRLFFYLFWFERYLQLSTNKDVQRPNFLTLSLRIVMKKFFSVLQLAFKFHRLDGWVTDTKLSLAL